MFPLSGFYRLTKQFALVTENVMFSHRGNIEGDESFVTSSLAVRIMGKNISSDIGLLFAEEANTLIPWLDVTYHW